MSWTRILAPLFGGANDEKVLLAAAALASPFDAHLSAEFIAVTPTNLLKWLADDGLNGPQLAIGSIENAALAGERDSRARFNAIGYRRRHFEVSNADGWEGLRLSARFSDVVVFDPDTARGEGFLAEAFQQVLMDERRPVLVANDAIDLNGPVAVAWDAGREASRAARRAVPLLQQAKDVLVFIAPNASPRAFTSGYLIDYLAEQGVKARPMLLAGVGEAGPLLMEHSRRLGVEVMVAGAFGHPRLQRFIFGGTTQTLLDQRTGPALFLSH